MSLNSGPVLYSNRARFKAEDKLHFTRTLFLRQDCLVLYELYDKRKVLVREMRYTVRAGAGLSVSEALKSASNDFSVANSN